MVYILSVIKTEVYAALNINFEVYAVCSKLLIIVQVFTKVLFAVSQQELIYHAIITKCPILYHICLYTNINNLPGTPHLYFKNNH